MATRAAGTAIRINCYRLQNLTAEDGIRREAWSIESSLLNCTFLGGYILDL